MKKFSKIITISFLPFLFFACSKKMQTFQFGNHPTQGTANNVIQKFSVASTSNEIHYMTELPNPAIMVARQTESEKMETTSTAEKPTFKQRVVQKMMVKKIQKMEKNLAMTSNMKLGIVIAAVSLLVLIIVAAGLLGGLSGLFWLLGGLGLLTGLLIMLLVALDVL